MSSKVKLLSALFLATALTGCGSSGTVTGSIPDWGGGNDGGGNDGGGNDGGGNDGGGDDGGGNDGGGNDAPSMSGHIIRYDLYGGESALPDSQVATGNATVTVSEDGSTAEVEVAADGMNMPNSGVMESDYPFYENDEGSFLQLHEGENYLIAEYSHPVGDGRMAHDYHGYFVGGDRTPAEQINASASYSGVASGEFVHSIPHGGAYGENGFEGEYAGGQFEGAANLDLAVNGSNATVSGAITDLWMYPYQGADGGGPDGSLPGQITLEEANVVDGAYDGSARFDIPGGATTTASNYQGAFYGENAAETAGTFHMEGGVPMEGEGMVDVNLVGHFGGSKVED